VLDKEFAVLSGLAKKAPGSFDFATEFSKTFSVGGKCPNPKVFKNLFSAAFEHGEVTITKIMGGAKRTHSTGRFAN
jgi:hypothetical protein